MKRPERLYHFTCDHGRRDIGTGNCLLLPHVHPYLRTRLIWLTTESNPDRRATGLTSKIIACDRMRWRYIVDDLEYCRPWLESPERARLSQAMLESFEIDDNGVPAAPEQWWISDHVLHARFDRSYQETT